MTQSNLEINLAAEKRRRISFGIVLIVVGLAIYLLFAVNTQPGAMTTFGLNLLSSQAAAVPDLVVPALPAIQFLAAVAVFTRSMVATWARIHRRDELELRREIRLPRST